MSKYSYKGVLNNLIEANQINNIFEWYYDETYLRGEKYLKENINLSLYHTDLDDLNNIEEVYKMLKYF